MSDDGDPLVVDLVDGLEIIKRPAQAPAPGRDRAPAIGGDLVRGAVDLVDALREGVAFVVGLDVSVPDGRQA